MIDWSYGIQRDINTGYLCNNNNNDETQTAATSLPGVNFNNLLYLRHNTKKQYHVPNMIK